ncbi:NTP transferase domain-containing protein [Microvirga sp. 2MCAF38]|uniref:nucleotidyltransferase family protein n=1 Tax=Microvirga sp. 2MCAF38 TaxID=3232989 RepID=UPI003F9A792A
MTFGLFSGTIVSPDAASGMVRTDMNDVAAIVLAAGRSTRFDEEPKLLASLRGKTLIRHAVEAALGSVAEPVIVVTGHRAEEIEAVLRNLPVQVVRNRFFADGLSTSLKIGFAALPPGTRAAVILLGDMPLITTGLIDTLVNHWRALGAPAALVPTVNGQRGHPLVISRELESMVQELSGDVGAGPSLRERADVVEWPVADPAVLQDVDTAEELKKL